KETLALERTERFDLALRVLVAGREHDRPALPLHRIDRRPAQLRGGSLERRCGRNASDSVFLHWGGLRCIAAGVRRGPLNVARPCIESTLSSTNMSPFCQGKATVLASSVSMMW